VSKIIKENNPLVNITLDPLENRGFKYHSGLSFTIFSKNFRGEIAKGGRYLTVSDETATGCTIYTEKIYNSAKDFIENKLVYIPFLNINDANDLIKKGYDVIFGTSLNFNIEQEAHKMGCKYIWKNETIIELYQ
jgi:ATP phosphoribosyltransferase regulatory subunit